MVAARPESAKTEMKKKHILSHVVLMKCHSDEPSEEESGGRVGCIRLRPQPPQILHCVQKDIHRSTELT